MILSMLFVLAAVIPPPDVEELKAHLKACQLRTAIQTHIDAVTGIVPVSTTTVGKNQFTEYAIPAVNSYGRSIVQGDRIWIPSAGELNTGQGDEIMRLSTSGNYVSYWGGLGFVDMQFMQPDLVRTARG
jgi:hypothetical protein